MQGSPSGIILIMAGVVLLALGWTGRWEAVWEALMTGEVPTVEQQSATPPAENPQPTYRAGQAHITYLPTGAWDIRPAPNGSL